MYFLLGIFCVPPSYSIDLDFSLAFCVVTCAIALVVGVVGLGWLDLETFLGLVTTCALAFLFFLSVGLGASLDSSSAPSIIYISSSY